MDEYDVIVVGAGPAGSTAAKAAVELKAKTILLEEHPVIGIPTHCQGYLGSPTRPDIVEEILRTIDKRVVLEEPTEGSARHIFAPNGKLVKVVLSSGVYRIDRAALDHELAKQAVNAGADLRLNTRATSLLKRDGRVIGVMTNSRELPKVIGKVVVAADGIYGALRGVAKWESLARRQENGPTRVWLSW
jgi:digeranylgeranylglycerophospholipid reductase